MIRHATCLLASENKLRKGPLDVKKRHLNRLNEDEERITRRNSLPDMLVTIAVPNAIAGV